MGGLKYRHEEKYMINKRDYLVLKKRLSNVLSHDPHARNGEYNVRSLYFDDVGNSALYEKLAGVSDRKKYRIRVYNCSDQIILLEKKMKKKQYTAKTRQEITREEYENIISKNTKKLFKSSKPLLRELALQLVIRQLRPMVIVDYFREAYIGWPGNVRITFDKYIKTGLNRTELLDKELPLIEVIEQGQFVLEVKYDGFLPGHVKIMLQLDGRYKQSVSKYTLCRKYIKTNRWEDQ